MINMDKVYEKESCPSVVKIGVTSVQCQLARSNYETISDACLNQQCLEGLGILIPKPLCLYFLKCSGPKAQTAYQRSRNRLFSYLQ